MKQRLRSARWALPFAANAYDTVIPAQKYSISPDAITYRTDPREHRLQALAHYSECGQD